MIKDKSFLVLIIAVFLISYTGIYIFADDTSASNEEEEIIYDEMDDLDSLFDEPADDIILEEEDLPEVDHRETFEKSETVTVKGSISTTGVIGAGWAGWNFIQDLSQGFDPSAGITSKASLSFDARPVPEFRVYGSLSTSFNPLDGDTETMDEIDELYSSFTGATVTASWDGITISSLYCDYILKDFLYTRIGKHSFSWGQARLYKVGNIMSDSGNTYNVRFSIPTLAGLSLVMLTNEATTVKDAVYAAKADFVLGNLMISPAFRLNWDDGNNFLLSYKQVLFGTDFLVDANISYSSVFRSAKIVSGFFHEWENALLYGEYLASFYSDGRITHNGGLAIGLDNPFGAPFDLGAKVLHNFMDSSGTVTLGLTQRIFPFIDMNIGIPIVYGSNQSSAVEDNSDPSKRRLAFILALTLKGSF